MIKSIVFILCAIVSFSGHAAWDDYKNKLKETLLEKTSGNSSQSLDVNNLLESDIISGLKEALSSGVNKSINKLGVTGGFINDKSVKIEMPSELNKLDRTLRKMGKGKRVDEFVVSMNKAAEMAVPKTADILYGVLKKMSLTDARKILNGKSDEATQYFKRNSMDDLKRLITPLIKSATDSVGVIGKFKSMMTKHKRMVKYLVKEDVDIDQYITDKTIDALFIKIAVEESEIRKNPAKRTTDILKKVFG